MRLDGSRGGGGKTLLLTLTALLAALLLATLGVGAQTNDGSDDAGAPQGRIIARVQDRTDDGVDDYRIEFGFFPEWALDDKDPWSEAIDRWSEWLPRARYLTKAVLDGRDADDNRRWLRSSLISVPAGPSAPQDGGADAQFAGDDTAGANLIEGRVVARYSPDSRGRLRVEFGFLPECAFTSTADTQEAVAQYGEQFLPRARYLTASLIENRRGDWLRSSPVEIPADSCANGSTITITPPPTREFNQGEAIERTRIGEVAGQLTTELDPITVTGAPPGLTIELDAQQRLILSGTVEADVGSYSVQVTVRPATGNPISGMLTILVRTAPLPELRWDNYSPARGQANTDVEIPAPRVIRGPTNPKWSYASNTPAICSVRGNTLTLRDVGRCLVTATSAATEGFREGTVEAEIDVRDNEPTSPTSTWLGYNPNRFAVFGEAPPPIIEPTATVEGRFVRLTYTYEVVEGSERVCDVNANTGALIARTAGDCILVARSAETDDYAESQSRPVVVTIAKAQPDLRWDGYGDDLHISDDPIRPISDPQPLLREARGELTYTYSATPGSVCFVDRSSGELTLLREGSCDVTVRSAETDNFLDDQYRIRVNGMELPPEISSVNCPPSADVSENITCTVRNDGGPIDTYSWFDSNGGSGASTIYRTSFSTPGRKTISVTVRNSAGSDSDLVTVEVRIVNPGPISCTPDRTEVGERVTCTVPLAVSTLPGYSWSWSGGDSSGTSATYSTTFSTPGTKTVTLTVRALALDARSVSASTTVEVQPKPPEIRISCPSSADVDENITCTVSNSGGAIDSYDWSDSDDGSGSSTSYSTSFSSSGTKTVSLTARNSAGSGNDSAEITVSDVPVEPVINSISCTPSPVATSTSVGCSANVSGTEPLSYSWSSGDSNGSSSTYSPSWSTEGAKTVSLTVRNSAGSDSDSTAVTVMTPPSISSLGCPSSATVNQAISCSPTVTGTEPLTYSWSGGDSDSGQSGSTYSPSWSTTGNKTVSLTVTNAVGSDSDSANVGGDVPPPDPAISCTPSTVATNRSVSCEVSSNSGGVISTYAWSGGPSNGSGSSYSPSWSSAGSKTVSLTASNAGGSGSDSTSVTVMIPPSISSLGCPSSATVNQAISCSPTVTGTEPLTYSWSGGDSDSGQSGSTYSPSWSTDGNKTVSLTVTNDVGNDVDSTSVKVTEAVPRPVISISCSRSSANKGDSVTCSVSSNSGGAIDGYSWSASGGSPSSGSSSTYSPSFSTSGTKTVSLTARNSAGSDSDSTSVSVVNRNPERVGSILRIYVAVGRQQTINVSGNFSDPDPGDRLTYDARSSSTSTAGVSTSGSIVTATGGQAGSARITVTAKDPDDATATQTFLVLVVAPPVVHIIGPARVIQGASATFYYSNDGGSASHHSWSGGSSSSRTPSYFTSFSSYGRKTVSLTASSRDGSGSDSKRVDVVASTTHTYARCGSDTIKVYRFNSSRLGKHWLNMTWEEVAARVSGWGESLIGHLSQAECNSWPDEPAITDSTWDDDWS